MKKLPNRISSLVELNQKERQAVLGSLTSFTKVFFKLQMGKEFVISNPPGRESHYISIAKALTKVFRGQTQRLIINIPPRYGKTTMLIYFVAWTMARYPDCNFLYTSYSHSLAAKQTAAIKNIMTLNDYQELFYVGLKKDTKAKFDFETNSGGSVYAAGIGGTITGRGAGIKGLDRFGGAIIIDDAHKPSEATSDVVRESVVDWFGNTLQSRRNNGTKTPIIFIGQRVHEADLAAYLMEGDYGEFEVLSLSALDEVGNALDPSLHTKEELMRMQEFDQYNFSAQYQQNPQPAGGGIFKAEWFEMTEDEPEILFTFITVDTAETDKTYNDATVFSFWGVYKSKIGATELDIYSLHWLDCWEIWIEPKDLEYQFMQFYTSCSRFTLIPQCVIIEKKSTGVTLSSTLSTIKGLQIIDVQRTKASGSKIQRFLEMQKYIAAKQVTLPENRKHSKMCIEHCAKITANDTHLRDDICDTLYDAVKLTLIDETLIKMNVAAEKEESNEVVSNLLKSHQRTQRLKRARSWQK